MWQAVKAIDPKKAARILANRMSAERTRNKRLNAIADLVQQVAY